MQGRCENNHSIKGKYMGQCKHGRSDMFCCECRYGKSIRTHSEKREASARRINVRDITEIPIGERFMNCPIMGDESSLT